MLNKKVLSSRRKVRNDEAVRRETGRVSHARTAATGCNWTSGAAHIHTTAPNHTRRRSSVGDINVHRRVDPRFWKREAVSTVYKAMKGLGRSHLQKVLCIFHMKLCLLTNFHGGSDY